MSQPVNKLFQFWQELKRRKVIRRNMVYLATGFVILEFVSIIIEPLRLPEWTLRLVLILLCIGFVISIILSWFFDFTPNGLERLKSTKKAKQVPPEKQPRLLAWKIATFISAVIIVGFVLYYITGGRKQSKDLEPLERSIAVLPFINDSPEEEGMYFINGTMESILDNLSKIQDLRVVSRTSVEQYRNNLKPVQEIAKEMNVAYILEGSGLKYDDKVRLTLQLIDAAHDRHVWSNSFNKSEGEVFELYSQVAQLVATEINAVITPEEKKRIENIPTTSQTALDLFQKAKEVNGDKAEELLHFSLEYDSTFSWPYIELAHRYLSKYRFNSVLFVHYMDSAKKMTEKALQFDPQSAEAHSLKGNLFSQDGKREEAVMSFDRAIELNPNLDDAYTGKGWLYFGENDYLNAIKNFQQSILRNRTPENLSTLYDNIGLVFSIMGFGDLAKQYYEKALNWGADTAWNIMRQAMIEFDAGNYNRTIEMVLKGYSIEEYSKNTRVNYALVILGESYMLNGQFEESLKYFEKVVYFADSVNWGIPWHKMPIAFIFLKNGYKEKAQYFLDLQIKEAEEWIEQKRIGYAERYLYLAMAYILKQDKDKALEYLRLFSQQGNMRLTNTRFPEHPIFSSIKDDPAFLGICGEIETKYQAEHERIRKWLEENDIL